jgi:hypothetical protein
MSAFWVMGAVVYTLVAIRAWVVLRRVEARIGRNERAPVIFCAAIWPLLAFFGGLMLVLADDCGVFAPGFKFDESADVDGAPRR